jgi:hypothetical protein
VKIKKIERKRFSLIYIYGIENAGGLIALKNADRLI